VASANNIKVQIT